MRQRSLYALAKPLGHGMRLLIYLLAMLTGFSAADAARPVSPARAELGSSVMALAVAEAALVAPSGERYHIVSLPSLRESATFAGSVLSRTTDITRDITPVSRKDRARI